MILPPGEYIAELGLSPDNPYVVALTADFAEVHLIHVADGQVRLNLPADPRTAWAFSPDGRYLLLTLAGGAIILNMADLSQQPIPMPYGRIGVSEGSVMPPLFWVDETAWYGLTPEGKDGFTLWRINVAEGTATAIGSYPGLALFTAFSPDGRYLAFWLETGEGFRDLHLVETATGQGVVYESGRLDLWFDHWQSDALHFIYRHTTNQGHLQMGHICQPPVTLDVTLPDHDLQWVGERGFFHLKDLTSDDSGNRGILYLQLLDGDTILIGELSAPPGSGINWSYFEQP
jgi:hypothetical protein